MLLKSMICSGEEGWSVIFDILQLIGGFILAFGFIPQIIQVIKTKSTVDLNLKTFLLMFLGIFLMEVYAINLVRHNTGGAFLITNTISLIAVGTMVWLTLKYGKKLRKTKDEKNI
jgi:MtN3 and saliva related transmembrane protein